MTCARTPIKPNPSRCSLLLHGCGPNRQENLLVGHARCNVGIGIEWHLVTQRLQSRKDADSRTTSIASDLLSEVYDQWSRAKVAVRALTSAYPVARAELASPSAGEFRWLSATSMSEGF